jgi:hypothetical protein
MTTGEREREREREEVVVSELEVSNVGMLQSEELRREEVEGN